MPNQANDKPTVFDATVFVIGKRLPSGNIYPQELAERIIMDVVGGEQKYTIEEVAPEERTQNGIMPYESWKKRAMAVCVDARLENARLIMTFKIYKTKYGKKLDLLLRNNPPGTIEFYPVGTGYPDSDGIVTNYKLAYVTFDVLQEVHG